ncbi:hypothetical protein CR983_03870 [Candidatus Saccharibacteria bacterium]|nr:MAG: hypothetical protein CR983_03870 [Candidatus Saccharibacteria bacterium]
MTADSHKKRTMKPAVWVVTIVIVSLLGLTGYFWNEARQARSQTPEAAQERNSKETEKVLTKLKSVLLVDDEGDPTVARIDDPEKLKEDNPDFYKNAKKDDYIIVYKQRAIIFRSSDKGQIINIAPIINTGEIKGDKKAENKEEPKKEESTEKEATPPANE